MANSKYEYVRLFEQPDTLLANTWIVVRIDGRGFSKLTTKYKFVKPNDRNALDLMNAAAEAVMKELPELVLAYGNSDEFSFVFHKDCVLFERRASKLTTTITSTFTSYYVFLWSQYFPDKPLTPPLPSFDGRSVCYPTDVNLRDYLSWRQVDCHINNLYNTTFWALVQQGGMDPRDAEQRLSGTVSSDKNEILFKEFGINYNNEPECFKKGSVLYRDFFPTSSAATSVKSVAQAKRQSLTIASPQLKDIPSRYTPRPQDNLVPSAEDEPVSPGSAGPGPTFLSTTSTPSPSPHKMPQSALPNPLRSNPVSPQISSWPAVTMPFSPPSTVTSPSGNMYATSGPGKQSFSSLTPLPLSPPILKPSKKPPLSLNAPNPTTRTNFSPTSPHDFPTDFPVSVYTHPRRRSIERLASHSTSASLTTSSALQQPEMKQRSPSQPHLPSYFSTASTQQAPVIPLRISSIPMNNKPRKLSLPIYRSMTTLRGNSGLDEKENMYMTDFSTPHRATTPLRTNKELPSPPMNGEQESRTRERVRSGSQSSSSPPRQALDHPGIAELPAESHRRLHSAPITSASLTQPFQMLDLQALPRPSLDTQYLPSPDIAKFPNPPPASGLGNSMSDCAARDVVTDRQHSQSHSSSKPPSSHARPIIPTRTKSAKSELTSKSANTATNSTNPKKLASHLKEQGGWAAGTKSGAGELSKTQRDKERKKRGKAKVLIEHIDLIRDEFWEKRGWLMSGKTG